MFIPNDSQKLPKIVPIVLRELARLHAYGDLTDGEFESKLERLVNEELTPRNLQVLVRHLADGTTRFLIKDQSGDQVHDLVDCHPGEAGIEKTEAKDFADE